MKTEIAKGEEKYIIKIIKLAKQEERVRFLNLINECPYLKKRDWIRAWLIRRITEKNTSTQNEMKQDLDKNLQGNFPAQKKKKEK